MFAQQIAKTISSEKKSCRGLEPKCFILCRILKIYISTIYQANSISTVISCDHFSHRDFDKNDVVSPRRAEEGGGFQMELGM